MGLEIRRTHDKDLYLAENRYEQPKEISKRLAALVEEAGLHRPGTVVADFGCAAGEFLFFLRRLWPEVQLLGFDVVPELIVKARARVPSVTFREGSVLDTAILPKSSMDVAFLSGVHSIFDDFEPCFSNLIEWTRPGGRVYVFGMFNPFPVDVWVKYRLVDGHGPNHREPGWNVFAKASVSRFLDRTVGPDRHRFIPFELPFDLAPHPTDPIRTWTMLDAEHRRRFTNGIGLLCNQEILEIRR